MRIAVERIKPVALPFILDDLKGHVRVDGADDDSALTRMGRTAAEEIEHCAQIALLTQDIRLTILDLPAGSGSIPLPIGPVIASEPITVAIDGLPFTEFDLIGGKRPFLRLRSGSQIATKALVLVQYKAGYGATSEAIPSDLAQALLDQAAMHYDGRGPQDAKALTSSPHMARIVARYRGVAL